MPDLTMQDVDDEALRGLNTPHMGYFAALALLAIGFGWGFALWVYQVKTGMGVAGINHPVMWGVYIGNYVFWIGIGMSGSTISGTLYLVRSKWRNAISRGAEAMTVFAVMASGAFPLIHLGRFWVFYYIIPYPTSRQIWSNYLSPLVWDLAAISTYLIASIIFYFVGLLPDLAMIRDWGGEKTNASSFRLRFYKALSLGWSGTGTQWHHFKRSYLFFAVLITPLAVSIHSVTSWDFSMALLPGWHTTLYAPYFVVGAVFSGMAMALTLLIPLRKFLRLENLIPKKSLMPLAKIVILTSLLLTYSYGIEHYNALFSTDKFEHQFDAWLIKGRLALIYWFLILLNVLMPLLLFIRPIRQNLKALFVIAIFVNVGMWLERYWLVTASTQHDYLPHNWGPYVADFVSLSITFASFCFFFLGVMILAKLFPAVATSDVKEVLLESSTKEIQAQFGPAEIADGSDKGVLGVFTSPSDMLEGLKTVRQAGFNRLETYSPYRVKQADVLLQRRRSPVRLWTMAGIIIGVLGAFGLMIGTNEVNDLIVGGKPVISIVPFCVIGFEGAIIMGVLFNLIAMLYYSHLGRTKKIPAAYDKRFSADKFGVFIACPDNQRDNAKKVLASTDAVEVKSIE